MPEVDNTLPTDPPVVDNTLPPVGEQPPDPGGPGHGPDPEPPTEPTPPTGGEVPGQTPGEEAKYHPPEPPDVYQDAPVQVTPPGTTADPETGLPDNPREPYPVGDGPVDAGKIKKGD